MTKQFIYPKKSFLEDAHLVHGGNKRDFNKSYWCNQYDLYARGERGLIIHDVTLVLMSPWDRFQDSGLNNDQLMEE
jgi:hypothetical protein